MPKVSIIIPVYRVEKLISECLDSILSQTYTDWECLLINDGSPDNSGGICDEYAKQDKRFKVFHQSNKGVSSARNFGIKKATGEWIAFVDSDDIVKPTYLQNLLIPTSIEDILVISNYIRGKNLGKNIWLNGQEICSYFIEKQLFALSAPYSKLYNKKILLSKEILFPEGINMGEDAIFNLRYMNVISKVAIVNELDYIVRVTAGSLSSRYYSFDSEYMCYKEWRKQLVTLFSRWSYGNNPVALAWQNRLDAQFRRCMLSVFRSGLYPSLYEKVSCLRKIEDSDIIECKKYAHTDILRRKINMWIICHKFFYLFSLLGYIDKFFNK